MYVKKINWTWIKNEIWSKFLLFFTYYVHYLKQPVSILIILQKIVVDRSKLKGFFWMNSIFIDFISSSYPSKFLHFSETCELARSHRYPCSGCCVSCVGETEPGSTADGRSTHRSCSCPPFICVKFHKVTGLASPVSARRILRGLS